MPSALCPRCNRRPKTSSQGYCQPCRNAYRRQYYRDNHETEQRRVRLDAWKRQGINLTWEQYQQLLTDQNGLCAICQGPPPDGHSLHVDHNQQTGQIRALLCTTCNIAIGYAQEQPHRLRLMADYLETHNQPAQTLRLTSSG